MKNTDRHLIRRVLIVDNQVIVRKGLRLLLESNGLEVVGDVENCDAAVTVAQAEQPTVVLLATDLADIQDLACVPRLAAVAPSVKVLILTSEYNVDAYYGAILAGVCGIVRKSEVADVLLTAIRRVTEGEVWLSGAVMARVLNDFWQLRQARESGGVISLPVLQPASALVNAIPNAHVQPDDEELLKIARLTEREREVIGLIGEGLRNQQVADRLSISVITVRHHLSSIFAKLDVGDRFELAIYAYRNGLAKLPL